MFYRLIRCIDEVAIAGEGEHPGSIKQNDSRARIGTHALIRSISVLAGFMGLLMTAMPSHAQYATGGNGQYRGQIYWFDWGGAGTNIPQAGTTITNTITVSGQALAITCTLSGISGNGTDPDLALYQPGNYFEDGLDDLYNIGGAGAPNTMDIGLRNRTVGAGRQATFTYSCSATLAGSPFVLDGLVFADAETTNVNEFIRTTLPAGTAMRVIERYRGSNCSTGYNVNLTGSTYTFTSLPPYTCVVAGQTEPQQANAMGVYFIDNTSALTSMSATITIGSDSGNEAVALGVLMNTADYGDAPGSYGTAAHIVQRTWSGGTLPAGDTNIFSSSFSLGTVQPPVTALLGSLADVESSVLAGAGATGDDSNGTDDEDGVNVAALAPLSAISGGSSYSVPVSCVGTAPVAGWIDFDRNGVFDADERSATATCSGGGANLTWTVNADVTAGQSYLRVRTAVNAAEIANPTGLASSGETEDYAIVIAAAADFGSCGSGMLLTQGASTTDLIQFDLSTNPIQFNTLGQASVQYNATGYNPSDDYLYAIRQTGNPGTNAQLVRIAADGTSTIIDADPGISGIQGVGNLSATQNWVSGTFSGSGMYYVMAGGGASTLKAINIGALPITATNIALSQSVTASDIAWVGGTIYAVTHAVGGGGANSVVAINPATGQVTTIGPAGTGLTIGALYGGSNGTLFGTDNGGSLYQFDLTTGAATLIAGSPGSTVNDGANCPNAPLAFNADPTVTKTNTPEAGPSDQANDTYLLGENVIYTIVVSNSGPFGAQNVTVNDPLPTGITTGSWTCTGTGGGVCAASGTGAINDTTVDLPAGATVTYLLTLAVPANYTGTLANTVTITPSASTNDTNAGNNSATDNDRAHTVGLSVTKTNTPATGPGDQAGDSVTSGTTTTYLLVVGNAGPDAADGAVIRDPATSGLTCTSVTCNASGGASCPATVDMAGLQGDGLAIPVLPVGASVTFALTCSVP